MIALPVLWLYGASGVGKTTVTWELFVRLVREGLSTGYVDIDQLGMCYGPPTPQEWAPEPAADPGRHRLKARTLGAVVANFRDAGAQCVTVPGVTDPVRGVETDLVPHAALTTCRLRVEPADLGRRLAARGCPTDDLAEELAYADAPRPCLRDRPVPRHDRAHRRRGRPPRPGADRLARSGGAG